MRSKISFLNNSKHVLFVILILVLSVGLVHGQIINVDKYAEEVECNVWDIITTFEGDPGPAPIDVILVLDRSGSMNYESSDPDSVSMHYVKTAAKQFAYQILNDPDAHPDNRVGLVSYATTASNDVSLTGTYSTVKTGIDALTPTGFTNIQQGFAVAQANMSTPSGDCDQVNRAIVLLTDGVANRMLPNPDPLCTTWPVGDRTATLCTQAAFDAGLAIATAGISEVFTINFTASLIGGGNGASLPCSQDVLDSDEDEYSSGYYETIDEGDLSGIFTSISSALLVAATGQPANAFVEDDFSDFWLVSDLSAVSSVSGALDPPVNTDDAGPKQSVDWGDENTEIGDEVITVTYRITADINSIDPSECGIIDGANESAWMYWLDATCTEQSLELVFPDVFVTCIDVSVTVDPDQPIPECELPPAGYALDATVTHNLNEAVPPGTIDSYQWTSDVGGTFDTPTSEDTNWSPPGGFSGSATLTQTVTASTGCSSDDAQAVVIVEVIPCDYDDLPASFDGGGDPYAVIQPLATGAGPRLHIGAAVTGEANGWDSPTGVGDADDGVTISPFPKWTIGNSCTGLLENGVAGTITMDASTYCFEVPVTNNSNDPAQLVAWIDWNLNGAFEANERSVVITDGMTGNVPAGATNTIVVYWTGVFQMDDQTFTRLILTTDASFKSATSPDPLGGTSDGEIEGYLIESGELPVELTSFTAVATMSGVQLDWRTESEIENLGFVLERMSDGTGWTEIASYKSNDDLLGQGTTSSATDYSFTDQLVQAGVTYEYRLADVDYNGVVTYHSTRPVTVEQAPLAKVDEFTVMPAYPNPFNPSTTIRYGLEQDGRVIVQIYDISGKLITTLVNEEQSLGWHTIQWNATNQHGEKVPAGIYLTRIGSGNKMKTVKLMLLK